MARHYRICVRGQLDASWSDRMAGLRITSTTDAEGPLTILEGPVRDQSQLTGVLDTLSDLSLTLVSVQFLPAPPDVDAARSDQGARPAEQQWRRT